MIKHASKQRLASAVSAALLTALCLSGFPICHAQMTNFIVLESGTPPPLNSFNLAVNNAGPGAQVSPQPGGRTGFNVAAGFGDLSAVTNGLPATAVLGLRVRGDIAYTLTTAQTFFTAQNLQYRGVPQGAEDRGSFIRMTAGTPVGRGPDSNPGGSTINPALVGEGLTLSQVSVGTPNQGATMIMTGTAPSVRPSTPGMPGTGAALPSGIAATPAASAAAAQENSVEVPVFFTVPTGFALGPIAAGRPGTFATNLQFAVFPRP
jgi:hypothetical protein